MQKYANLVELEKCCQTHIFLQNFVLIRPRTSPPKICKILPIFPILLTRPGLLRVGLRQFRGGVGRRDHDEVVLVPHGPGHGVAGLVRVPRLMLTFMLTFGEFLVNFERVVLGCIEAGFCKQILV